MSFHNDMGMNFRTHGQKNVVLSNQHDISLMLFADRLKLWSVMVSKELFSNSRDFLEYRSKPSVLNKYFTAVINCENKKSFSEISEPICSENLFEFLVIKSGLFAIHQT